MRYVDDGYASEKQTLLDAASCSNIYALAGRSCEIVRAELEANINVA